MRAPETGHFFCPGCGARHPRRCARHKPQANAERPRNRCREHQRRDGGGTARTRRTRCPNKTRVANNAPRMDWPSTLQGNGHKVNPGTHRGHGVQPSSQPSKSPTDTTKTEPKLTAQNSVQQSSHQAKPAKLNHGSTARFWVFLPSIPQFTRLGIRQAHHNLKRSSQSSMPGNPGFIKPNGRQSIPGRHPECATGASIHIVTHT